MQRFDTILLRRQAFFTVPAEFLRFVRQGLPAFIAHRRHDVADPFPAGRANECLPGRQRREADRAAARIDEVQEKTGRGFHKRKNLRA